MSLAVSGYIRQFYKGNLFGATANGRHGQPSHSLLSADIKAIRRAVRELGDYGYGDKESDGEELVDKVQAFVSTYNNYMDSAKGMEDGNVDRYLSKLKKLTKENAQELSDIGITVQGNGKLQVNERELQSTGRYQVSKLFSADAEYGKQVEKQMKQTYNMFLRNNLNIPKQSVKANSKTEGSEGPSVDDGAVSGSGNPPAAEDIQLAQQLAQVLAGSKIDYAL